MKPNTRIIFLDLARCFAVIMVVLVHATEHVYTMSAGYFKSLSLVSKIFAASAFTMGRVGVPLFLFLTGYLILGRKFSNDECIAFWKNNWLRLFLTTEIWILIYNVFFIVVQKQSPNFYLLAKEMVFLVNFPMAHMWYMPMIIGMYLFLPVFSKALTNIDTSILKFPMGLLAISLFVMPMLMNMLGENAYSRLDPGFSGGLYGYYIILGFLVLQGVFDRIRKPVLVVMAVVSFIITVNVQLFLYSQGITRNVWYNWGTLAICALSIFVLLKNSFNNAEESFYGIVSRKSFGIVRFISQFSFAIYLIHYPVLLLFEKIVKGVKANLSVKVLLLWITTFLCSAVLCFVLGKVTYLRKYLLYVKD